MSVFEKIKSLLETNSIPYHISEHEKVRTSEEAAKARGTETKTGAKAMVVKAKDKYILCVLPGNLRIDWEKLKQLLSVKRIRLATQIEAEELTGVEMGAVPPFGNLLGITEYLDPKVLENESINFNPGSRIHTINMKSEDLVKVTSPIITPIT